MSLNLALYFVATCAVLAFSASLLLAGLLVVGRRSMRRLAAAAQARVVFLVALTPLFVAIGLTTIALVPSFGLLPDHCLVEEFAAPRAHLCSVHHQTGWLTLPLLVLALGLIARVVWTTIAIGLRGASAVRIKRGLWESSQRNAQLDVRVLPIEEPQAFVVGVLDPVIFITQGLLEPLHREHLAAALAHERAHLERRDALYRVVAAAAGAFHLTVIAGWVNRELSRLHEAAADAAAAQQLNSPARVARALVHLARASLRSPRFAIAFAVSELETRVSALLDERARPDRPSAGGLAVLVTVIVAVSLVGAHQVHHGVDSLLSLFAN